MKDSRRNDWTSVIAVALIGLGVWFLLGNVLGPTWHRVVGTIWRIGWPVALIIVGILLYVSSQRGGLDFRGKRLYRSRSNRMLAGVLGGLGELLGIDATWLRIAFVILAFLNFGVVVLYIIAVFVIPEEPAGGVAPPSWPRTGWGGGGTSGGGSGGAGSGAPAGPTPPPTSSGWPHTGGTETVQQPPPATAPSADEPTTPGPPDAQPPGEHGPAQS